MNILLFNKAEIAKIADFGLSKIIENQSAKMTSYIGTKDYMAPEIFEKAAVPFKGDIYSLGLILHFMMAKDLPSIKHNVKLEISTFLLSIQTRLLT